MTDYTEQVPAFHLSDVRRSKLVTRILEWRSGSCSYADNDTNVTPVSQPRDIGGKLERGARQPRLGSTETAANGMTKDQPDDGKWGEKEEEEEEKGDGSDDSLPSWEHASQHSVYGDCPWQHFNEPDCTCECINCGPNVRQRLGKPERARYCGPGRVHFPPSRPLQPFRASQYQMTPPDPDILSIISHLAGEFRGPEISDNFPVDRDTHNNLTLALGQRPCTEMIPWNSDRKSWDKPCPNDRRGATKMYRGRIEKYQSKGRSCPDGDPPGDPCTPDRRRYVCERHFQDSKTFFHEEDLIKAHLVGTCPKHMRAEIAEHPFGYSSCTCHNLLDKWQCRLCYEGTVSKLRKHFRRRVLARWDAKPTPIGGNNPLHHHDDLREKLSYRLSELTERKYYLQWEKVRRLVVKTHPCHRKINKLRACGRKRLHGDQLVMDCRACGGVIVKPTQVRNQQPVLDENSVEMDRHASPTVPRSSLVEEAQQMRGARKGSKGHRGGRGLRGGRGGGTGTGRVSKVPASGTGGGVRGGPMPSTLKTMTRSKTRTALISSTIMTRSKTRNLLG